VATWANLGGIGLYSSKRQSLIGMTVLMFCNYLRFLRALREQIVSFQDDQIGNDRAQNSEGGFSFVQGKDFTDDKDVEGPANSVAFSRSFARDLKSELD
jgi:hypothetical protein